jgi:hypothetical protein
LDIAEPKPAFNGLLRENMPEAQTIKKYLDGRAICADSPRHATLMTLIVGTNVQMGC